eukprot:scaffold69386_cov30-Phaeocystis_antarctica.AAC.2
MPLIPSPAATRCCTPTSSRRRSTSTCSTRAAVPARPRRARHRREWRSTGDAGPWRGRAAAEGGGRGRGQLGRRRPALHYLVRRGVGAAAAQRHQGGVARRQAKV